jgi:agmatine/peptidylarginine deiminase
MFLWPIAPRTRIVSEYPDGSPQDASIAPALKALTEQRHTIHRVPGLEPLIYDDINAMPNYANGVITNGAALVPQYNRKEDEVVCGILKDYGYAALPIDCSEIILSHS